MRAAIYARVSTPRQARDRKTDQQVARLEQHAQRQGWVLDGGRVYLDEGYSGASLKRPGLDALRDAAAMAEFEVLLVSAPDRLARKYVHQVLLLEELQGHGCRVEFLERPMSQDPNDQLLLQIRGAVAEYERTLIAERLARLLPLQAPVKSTVAVTSMMIKNSYLSFLIGWRGADETRQP